MMPDTTQTAANVAFSGHGDVLCLLVAATMKPLDDRLGLSVVADDGRPRAGRMTMSISLSDLIGW